MNFQYSVYYYHSPAHLSLEHSTFPFPPFRNSEKYKNMKEIVYELYFNIKISNAPILYIALQGTRQESLQQVKLGKTLNVRLFGVCF